MCAETLDLFLEESVELLFSIKKTRIQFKIDREPIVSGFSVLQAFDLENGDSAQLKQTLEAQHSQIRELMSHYCIWLSKKVA